MKEQPKINPSENKPGKTILLYIIDRFRRIPDLFRQNNNPAKGCDFSRHFEKIEQKLPGFSDF